MRAARPSFAAVSQAAPPLGRYARMARSLAGGLGPAALRQAPCTAMPLA